MDIKVGDWVVDDMGEYCQVTQLFAHRYTIIDSVFETREVAEIRSGIIKTDLANREPSRLFTSKAFVAQAMKILEDELVKSRKENLSKEGF